MTPRRRWRSMLTASRVLTAASILYSDSSKPRRPLVRYAEGTLHGDARASHHAFVEQPAEQRHAVRHPSRRREFRQRIVWIRRPVAARLGNFDEARAKRQ